MKYQKNNMNKILIIKYIINFILKHFLIDFDFSKIFWSSFSSFIDNRFASVKDSFFSKTFITADIIVENKIWGILYNILYLPLSSYNLCIVSSEKKNPLIEIYNSNERRNKESNNMQEYCTNTFRLTAAHFESKRL